MCLAVPHRYKDNRSPSPISPTLCMYETQRESTTPHSIVHPSPVHTCQPVRLKILAIPFFWTSRSHSSKPSNCYNYGSAVFELSSESSSCWVTRYHYKTNYSKSDPKLQFLEIQEIWQVCLHRCGGFLYHNSCGWLSSIPSTVFVQLPLFFSVLNTIASEQKTFFNLTKSVIFHGFHYWSLIGPQFDQSKCLLGLNDMIYNLW